MIRLLRWCLSRMHWDIDCCDGLYDDDQEQES